MKANQIAEALDVSVSSVKVWLCIALVSAWLLTLSRPDELKKP